MVFFPVAHVSNLPAHLALVRLHDLLACAERVRDAEVRLLASNALSQTSLVNQISVAAELGS